MTTSRTIAAVLFTVGALMSAAVASGFQVAGAVVVSGQFAVKPSDAALVADLVAVAPFIAAFAVASLIAAFGVTFDRTWSTVVATSVAATGVIVPSIGLALLILGRDPFAAVPSNNAIDGIAMLGSVAAYYAVTAFLVALGRARPVGRTAFAAA